MEDRPYFTLDIAVYKAGGAYLLDLSFTDPGSQAQVAPRRGSAAFDLTELLSKEGVPDHYGEALSRQLFADPGVKEHFAAAEAAAQSRSGWLRVSLAIDPSADELASLRWELLRHPKTGAALSTSERILFSRFMVSHDFHPVKLRARTDLTALVAVSAPPPGKIKFAPVDFDGEVTRIKAALGGLKVRTLGGPGAPFTLPRLIDALRDGVDVLYLVSHGQFKGDTQETALILQDDTGEAARVTGKDLAARFGELQKLPRLVVLASCQSAGDGTQVDPAHRTSVQATLAGRLAATGVPAVIAMQGFISMKTVEKMMPVFFAELLRDGQIDRALAAARGVVRDQPDAWMPALTTRLTDGRLWYTAGFKGGDSKEIWRDLLTPVRAGKLVPILGPRLLEAIHGGSHEIARELALAKRYPLARSERDDLPRVTQFIGVKARFNAIEEYKSQIRADLLHRHRSWLPPEAKDEKDLQKLLGLVGAHLRETDASDAYRILADLPASVYVTTNFDSLLEDALTARNRAPRRVLSRWRWDEGIPEPTALAPPTTDAPLVYHAFGAFGPTRDDDVNCLVLTADDYFDYLIQTSAAKLMPADVEGALVDNSLLFLGFRLTDWHFLVLFRLMRSFRGKKRLEKYCHVAVQLDPDLESMGDVAGAKDYLAKYFGNANINIYWGSAEEFLKALHDELSATAAPAVPPAPTGDDDEWS